MVNSLEAIGFWKEFCRSNNIGAAEDSMRSSNDSIQKKARHMMLMFVLVLRIESGNIPNCGKKGRRASIKGIKYAWEHTRSYKKSFIENGLTNDSKGTQPHSLANCVSTIGPNNEVTLLSSHGVNVEGTFSSCVKDKLYFVRRDTNVMAATDF